MGSLVQASSESARFNLPWNLFLKIERVEGDEDEAEHETVYQQRDERFHALLLSPVDCEKQLARIFPDPFYDQTPLVATPTFVKLSAMRAYSV